MKFKCPKCGNDTAEEVLTGCTVALGVDGITESGFPDYNGTIEMCDGDIIDRYQCAMCGFVLEGVTTQEEFVEYVKEKCKG